MLAKEQQENINLKQCLLIRAEILFLVVFIHAYALRGVVKANNLWYSQPLKILLKCDNRSVLHDFGKCSPQELDNIFLLHEN